MSKKLYCPNCGALATNNEDKFQMLRTYSCSFVIEDEEPMQDEVQNGVGEDEFHCDSCSHTFRNFKKEGETE